MAIGVPFNDPHVTPTGIARTPYTTHKGVIVNNQPLPVAADPTILHRLVDFQDDPSNTVGAVMTLGPLGRGNGHRLQFIAYDNAAASHGGTARFWLARPVLTGPNKYEWVARHAFDLSLDIVVATALSGGSSSDLAVGAGGETGNWVDKLAVTNDRMPPGSWIITDGAGVGTPGGLEIETLGEYVLVGAFKIGTFAGLRVLRCTV